MDNVFLLAGLFCIATVGVVLFGLYSVYGGSRASLCDAKVGQVFNFEYLQPVNGDSRRVLAKVLEPVVHFDQTALQRMNARSNYRRNDPEFERTNHLVTCKTADGNIRQFYCERVKNCRKPLFGWAVV